MSESRLEKNQRIARDLRDRGWSNIEIAAHFDVHKSTVSRWLNPHLIEKQLIYNRSRNAEKRQNDRDNAGSCENCGTGLSDSRAEHCIKCVVQAQKEAADARVRRWIALREEGLLNTEIAQRDGTTVHAVATAFSNAKRRGFHVPPSPYHRHV
jgi:transposase